MIKFKPEVQILDKITNNEIYIIESNKTETGDKIGELFVLAKFFNVSFDNPNKLNGLNNKSIENIKEQIASLSGDTLFNIEKEYGLQEAFKTISQYLRDYGNFDIPESLWVNYKDLMRPEDFKTVKFVIKNENDYTKILQEILNSTKNPDARAFLVLSNLKYTKELNFDKVLNKQTLKSILIFQPGTKFNPVNTAQLRIYAESFKKLKTSQKTFIMRNLEKFKYADIMDDFSAYRNEWKHIEKCIIPTQKRFKHFSKARDAFYNLRDSNFKESNNSQIARILDSNENSVTKFNTLVELKSAQFAMRNFTRIISTDTDFGELKEAILNSQVKLKHLLELYNSFSEPGYKTAKVKTKFYTYENIKYYSNYVRDFVKDLIENRINELKKTYAETLLTNTELKEKFDTLSQDKIRVNSLKGISLPLSTDNFMDSDDTKLLNRGSLMPLELKKFGVFVAWKHKSSEATRQDIDLSCNVIDSYENILEASSLDEINYTCLETEDGLKHSGDWTSCQKFDPELGFITAEAIAVDTEKIKGDLHFMINTFNNISLKDFDVYVGVIPYNKFKSKEKSEHSQFKLEDAVFKAKISGEIAGYYKLFTYFKNDKKLLFEGLQMNHISFASSSGETRNSLQSVEFCNRLRNFDTYDFVKTMYPDKTEVNIEKLKMFLDFAVNGDL